MKLRQRGIETCLLGVPPQASSLPLTLYLFCPVCLEQRLVDESTEEVPSTEKPIRALPRKSKDPLLSER